MTFDYINYAVMLFLLTAIFLLRIDVKIYRGADMQKEHKTAKVMGWVNIGLGVILYATYWSYNYFFW